MALYDRLAALWLMLVCRDSQAPESYLQALAGLRAGGALALDGVRQKITGEEGDSDFSRREALLLVEN